VQCRQAPYFWIAIRRQPGQNTQRRVDVDAHGLPDHGAAVACHLRQNRDGQISMLQCSDLHRALRVRRQARQYRARCVQIAGQFPANHLVSILGERIEEGWRQLLVLHQSESHEDVLIPRKSRGQSRYDLLPRTQHEWIPRQGHSGTCSNRCVWIPQVDTGSERCVRIGGNKKSDPKVFVISEEGQFSWIRTRVGPSLLFVIDALLGPHQVADPPAIELTKVPA